MYRTKDFTMMDVVGVTGRKIGFIKDILMDFHDGKIKGFSISPSKLFVKNAYVLTEDIVSFDKIMIIRKTHKECFLSLKDFIGTDFVDRSGNIIGVLEDIIFDSQFKLKGMVISSGIINKLLKGKKIVLINEVVVGDENFLYLGDSAKVSFVSVPHKLIGVE